AAWVGIDGGRDAEAGIMAARLGIGPEVLRFADGVLVTRVVAGEVGRADIATVGTLLKRLHDAPAIGGRFASFRVVEAYAAAESGRGRSLPRVFGWAHELARQIEALRAAAPRVTCHNDLLAANFIDDGERVWVVDWEYAGMGDPFFDLANFAVNNDLDEDGDRALLEAYGGGDEDVHVLFRFMSDFREAMWGVVQQALSELDFNFAAYADEHFERL